MKYKLIKEYPGSPDLGWISNNNWKGYPEFWEEIVEKDYKILEVKGKYGAVSSYIEELDNDLKDKTIFKIKRLSDGEIFTIGDNFNILGRKGKIKSFEIISNLVWVKSENTPDSILNGLDFKKVKQPLFTTEDGVDIFEGDKYVMLDTSNWQIDINGGKGLNKKDYRIYFSTKEKAEKYILMNKPCLSLNDINNMKTKGKVSVFFMDDLERLVQQKLNK